MRPSKLTIAMCVPGMDIYPGILEEKSLGGSETAGIQLAEAFSKSGQNVLLFCNTKQGGDRKGVRYLPLDRFQSFAATVPHDVAIVQRTPEAFGTATRSLVNICWMHDMALGRFRNTVQGCLWNIDIMAVLSRYMRDQYADVYGLENDSLWITRNGLDTSKFEDIKKSKRIAGRLIYCARPERGLDRLLVEIFPKILERVPTATLAIAGYDNKAEHSRALYANCKEAAARFGDRVINLGHLCKTDLYDQYSRSSLYVYPTPSEAMPEFREVSCISAMEAQACGLPFISSYVGALPETVADGAGVLVPYEGNDNYNREFVDAVVSALNDDLARARMGEAGKAKLASMSWDAIASEWLSMIEDRVARFNGDPRRLALHFMRRSDVIAAKELCLRHDIPDVLSRINKDYTPWIHDDEEFRAHYQKIGDTHTDSYESAGEEGRLKALIQWLSQKKEIERVLDVGCAQGCYAIHASNAIDGLEVHGVDVDNRSIRWAEEYRQKHAARPGALEFFVESKEMDLHGYDCLLACEVLEHVRVPWEFVTRWERSVKRGGHLYITVPSGPWEHMSYHSYPHRCHLWEFDWHDLSDMFAGKPELSIDYLPGGLSNLTGEQIGWHIVTYRVDHAPAKPIDMGRKLGWQRPRESVSASIIAGPGCELTLQWMIESVRFIADEIVIADNGISDVAKLIASAYEHARIVEGADPLIDGFDVPRNIALEHCCNDWVLWIDTDERLINSEKLTKYIRANHWNGYGIKQHHFAVDTQFSPDMPVRLYRRKLGGTDQMRHYGKIHEHPELGLNKGPGPIVVLADVHIAHLGYLSEDIRQRRYWRNLPMLQKDIQAYPDRVIQKHFVCRDNILMAKYLLQLSGGGMTERIKGLCEETIDLYRKHFVGKSNYVNIDTLQYYSEALKILGRGVDIEFNVQAEPPGVMNGRGTRFDTIEDAVAEITWRTKDAMTPLLSKIW